MNASNYYVSAAANPIELAERNVPFYTAFIQEMGCSRLYRNLWVGENLETLIENFRRYQPECDELKIRKASIVSQYEKFYQQFTGQKLK